jgi:hypothetical protein
MLTDTTSTLPRVVADHLAACNDHDPKAMMATFAADAFVNDAGRAFLDRAAIQAWIETEIVGPKVTMDVTDAVVRRHSVILHARIDGEYDKTGLPDPLVLAFHFGLAEGQIAQLVITRIKPIR